MAFSRLSFLRPLLALVTLTAGLPCAGAADPLPVTGRNYALLVGVKNYRKDELTSLKYTENDVTALARDIFGGDLIIGAGLVLHDGLRAPIGNEAPRQ